LNRFPVPSVFLKKMKQKSQRSRIGIVGAGPAGLAAAWALRDAGLDLEVTVFEKSRGVCGRAASRTRHGLRLDPGANYLKAEPEAIRELVTRQLPNEELVSIEGDIWLFDREGRIEPGDPEQNREPKWTYRHGISTLGKLLAAASQAAVKRGTCIVKLAGEPHRWTLVDAEGGEHGPFHRILLTPPGPQTVELLERSALDKDGADLVVEGLRQARYHRQWCFALGFAEATRNEVPWYALLNADGVHPLLAWISRDNAKPGRIPRGITVVSVQMHPDWSTRNFERTAEDLVPEVVPELNRLLGWPDHPPAWWDAQRWKFAHPYRAADGERVQALESAGIFVAGDALVGKGRVNLAMHSGLEIAERMRSGEP